MLTLRDGEEQAAAVEAHSRKRPLIVRRLSREDLAVVGRGTLSGRRAAFAGAATPGGGHLVCKISLRVTQVRCSLWNLLSTFSEDQGNGKMLRINLHPCIPVFQRLQLPVLSARCWIEKQVKRRLCVCWDLIVETYV